jgi:ubiquinone/menaquinone biosynthesis C-methylase UbiE
VRHHAHARHGNRPEYFHGRASRIYDLAARWLIRAVYRRFAEDIALVAPANGAVLDIGTGPGVLLFEIALRRPDLRLTGIDLSADMVAAATRNASPYADRVTTQVGDVTDLSMPDGSFDLAISSFSLHHWDRPEAAVPELARVLRTGGRTFIYDFQSAPFDILTGTAATHSLFTAAPPQLTAIRTRVPFFRHCARLVMSK